MGCSDPVEARFRVSYPQSDEIRRTCTADRAPRQTLNHHERDHVVMSSRNMERQSERSRVGTVLGKFVDGEIRHPRDSAKTGLSESSATNDIPLYTLDGTAA